MSQFLALEKRVAVIQAVMDGVLHLLGVNEPAREPAPRPAAAAAAAAPAVAVTVTVAVTKPAPLARPRDERYPRGGEPANQSSAIAP